MWWCVPDKIVIVGKFLSTVLKHCIANLNGWQLRKNSGGGDSSRGGGSGSGSVRMVGIGTGFNSGRRRRKGGSSGSRRCGCSR